MSDEARKQEIIHTLLRLKEGRKLVPMADQFVEGIKEQELAGNLVTRSDLETLVYGTFVSFVIAGIEEKFSKQIAMSRKIALVARLLREHGSNIDSAIVTCAVMNLWASGEESSKPRSPSLAEVRSKASQARRSKRTLFWVITASLGIGAVLTITFVFFSPSTKLTPKPSEQGASQPSGHANRTAPPEEKPLRQPVAVVTQTKPADPVAKPVVQARVQPEPVAKVASDRETIPAPETRSAEKPTPPEHPTWTDMTGKYRTEAAFVGVASGKVTLKKRDGATVQVPLDKLSKEDHKWIEDQDKGRAATTRLDP